MKSKTLAFALLASSVSVGANAYETSSALGSTSVDKDAASEHESTYWGVGLGTVFGALIGGPPGAAIGASIGGSLGWGVDNQTALDETELSLAEKELALLQRDEAISSQQAKLVKTQQVVAVLSETNSEQAKQLALFEEKGGKRALNQGLGQSLEQSLEQNTLEQVASHYSHEVYYRNGQHAVPDYAQQKLLGLAEFLIEHQSLEVSLKGYTDHRGSPELNKKLAHARTEGVKDLLVAQGVSAHRIHLKAIGEGELKAKPGEPSNYALDRRVAIELQLNDADAVAETEKTVEESEQGALALDEEQGIQALDPAQASVFYDVVSPDALLTGAASPNASAQESATKSQHLSTFMTFAEAR